MIDITKYIQAAHSQTEKDADALVKAYLKDLAETREATLDEVAKAYSKYLDGVEKENYLSTMTKNGRMDMLLASVQGIMNDGDRRRRKYLENQSKIGTNDYYYLLFIMSAVGVDFKDMGDAVYYAITGRTPDARIIVDKITWTVSDYIKETVKDKARRDAIYNTYFAKGGQSTIDIIKDMDAVLSSRVTRAIKDAISSGKTYKELAKILKDQFGYSASRALTIARTELGRASGASQYAAWQESLSQGVSGRRFLISAKDAKTRNQSANVDGQEEDVNGEWHYNGYTAKYAPSGWGNPAYDINDRETVGYRVDGDTDGNTMSARDVTAVSLSGKALSEYNLSTTTGRKSFSEWAKDQGVRRNIYGELYESRQ